LLAGLNAARFVSGDDPLTLRRDEAYIGVMADDLTTMEFIEPYRMLTARAEHRLILRADNAEDRLAELAYEAGLIDGARIERVRDDRRRIADVGERLSGVHLSPNGATEAELRAAGLPPASRSQTAEEYLRRPDVTLERLMPVLRKIHPRSFEDVRLSADLSVALEVQVKYQAYIDKEVQQIERVRSMESARIPRDLDYASLSGLRNEAREKLAAVRPTTLGQAGRIAGVTAGDVAVLAVKLRSARQSSRSPQDRMQVASG
jgi:tRNA uridine 5-carboxymethylaminomethyl modification enzyme